MPEEADLPIATAEQGKLFCDFFHKCVDVDRVELIDEKGQVLYARGYRSNPAAPVKRGKEVPVAEPSGQLSFSRSPEDAT